MNSFCFVFGRSRHGNVLFLLFFGKDKAKKCLITFKQEKRCNLTS